MARALDSNLNCVLGSTPNSQPGPVVLTAVSQWYSSVSAVYPHIAVIYGKFTLNTISHASSVSIHTHFCIHSGSLFTGTRHRLVIHNFFTDRYSVRCVNEENTLSFQWFDGASIRRKWRLLCYARRSKSHFLSGWDVLWYQHR